MSHGKEIRNRDVEKMEDMSLLRCCPNSFVACTLTALANTPSAITAIAPEVRGQQRNHFPQTGPGQRIMGTPVPIGCQDWTMFMSHSPP